MFLRHSLAVLAFQQPTTVRTRLDGRGKKRIEYRDDNFPPPRLTRPSPRKFSSPCKGGGVGMRQDFSPAPQGGDEFRLFRPILPCPFLSSPSAVLLRVIIVNFLYFKSLLFKQTYQYQLILFYLMWFSAFILLCVIL